MKYTEIKDKTAAELATMLKEKKVLLFTLKQKLKTMQLTNPKEISQVKKDIARINTAINALRLRIENGI
ncbi:50S ribosomal protein L29 [Campylobacter jejuni]